jgi:hypothetical protein
MPMLHQTYERWRGSTRAIRPQQAGKEASPDIDEAHIPDQGVEMRRG